MTNYQIQITALEALLRGAESALKKALLFLPADKEAIFVGEWLVKIAEVNRNNGSLVRMEQLQANGMYLVTFFNGSGALFKMMCDTLEDAEFCYTEYLKMVQT